ncbi:MAG TPA: hypothetical protein VKZ79_16545 [Alphaproteobacteria bacterium]|nr:hypothetical protein [Alphaproteobacteria bacterium]
MATTYAETRSTEAAAYGGLVDAIGGIATAVLAITALTGYSPEIMAGIATVVFGATLLIQGGTILSEYAHLASPSEAGGQPIQLQRFATGGLSPMFLIGASGIVLGVLALLGISTISLIAVATIAFGSALVLSSNSVRELNLLQTSIRPATYQSTGELLASEMASGSAGVQLLAGLATVVLGILTVAGRPVSLTLAALLVLGVTVVLTGSTLSALVLSFMRTPRISS